MSQTCTPSAELDFDSASPSLSPSAALSEALHAADAARQVLINCESQVRALTPSVPTGRDDEALRLVVAGLEAISPIVEADGIRHFETRSKLEKLVDTLKFAAGECLARGAWVDDSPFVAGVHLKDAAGDGVMFDPLAKAVLVGVDKFTSHENRGVRALPVLLSGRGVNLDYGVAVPHQRYVQDGREWVEITLSPTVDIALLDAMTRRAVKNANDARREREAEIEKERLARVEAELREKDRKRAELRELLAGDEETREFVRSLINGDPSLSVAESTADESETTN